MHFLTQQISLERLSDFQQEVLPHPSYSSNIGPKDYRHIHWGARASCKSISESIQFQESIMQTTLSSFEAPKYSMRLDGMPTSGGTQESILSPRLQSITYNGIHTFCQKFRQLKQLTIILDPRFLSPNEIYSN